MTIDIRDVAITLYDLIAQCDNDKLTRKIIDEIECDYYDDDFNEIDFDEIKRARVFMRAFCVEMINVIDTRKNDDEKTTLARCYSNR